MSSRDTSAEGHRIPALFALTIARVGEEMGVPRERFLRGLSLGARRFRHPLAKVTWDETAILWDRLEEAHPDAARVFAHHYCHRFPLVTWVATFVDSPRVLYQTAFRAWRWSFLELDFRQLDGWTFRVDVRLRPGARDSAFFFEVVGEILRELPRALQRERAHVDGFTSARMGTYVIRFESVPADASEEEIGEKLFSMLQQHARSLMPAAGIPAKWGLSPAETRTVLALTEGQTAKEIATTHGLSIETVRTQIKSAMSKAGVKRQLELVRRATD